MFPSFRWKKKVFLTNVLALVPKEGEYFKISPAALA